MHYSRDFKSIFLINLLIFTGFEVSFPVLSLWLLSLGATNAEAGIAISGFTLAALGARTWTGRWLTHHPAKPTLAIGAILGIGALALHPFVHSVVLIAFLRFANGIGWGMLSTAVNAWLTRTLDPKMLGSGVSVFGMGTSVAMAVGPFLGLALYAAGGMNWVILAATLIVAALFWPYSQTVSDGHPKRGGDVAVSTEKTPLSGRHFVPMALMTIFGVAYISILYFMPAYLVSIHQSGAGWYFLVQALMAFAVRPVVGRYYDRRGPRDLFWGGFLLIALAIFLLASVMGLGSLIISAALFGAGFGCLFSVGQARIVSFFDHHEHGRANALFFNSFDTGIFLGSIGIGYLSDALGYRTMYTGLSALLFLTAIVSFAVIKSRRTTK